MSSSAKPKFSVYSTSTQPPMHFSGANGFPVRCYEPLLTALSQRFSITSLWHTGLWPGADEPNTRRWADEADALISHLKKQNTGPVIGVGHSMGANITLLAAAKSPTLFSELILIEPVMVSRFHAFLFRYAPQSWLQKQEPVASALAAPTSWSTPELAYQHFRGHPAYKRMPDQTLKTMLKGLIDNHQGKTSLVYPKDWEIHNYLQVRPILNAFQTLKTPTVFIRGKSSLFVHDKSWQAMLRMKPDTLCFREMEYGHLLPLEAPGLTRQLIFSGLTKLRQAHSEP